MSEHITPEWRGRLCGHRLCSGVQTRLLRITTDSSEKFHLGLERSGNWPSGKRKFSPIKALRLTAGIIRRNRNEAGDSNHNKVDMQDNRRIITTGVMTGGRGNKVLRNATPKALLLPWNPEFPAKSPPISASQRLESWPSAIHASIPSFCQGIFPPACSSQRSQSWEHSR